MKTRYYAKYGFPNVFCADYSTFEIENTETVERKPGSFGYTVFSVNEVEENGEVFRGPPTSIGGWHYWGKVIDKENATGVLRENMDINNWDKAVNVVGGACYPLTENDVVIPD